MDVCCLNRPFDDQSHDRIRIESEAVLAILNRCQQDWTLAGSEAIDYEISKIPDDERKTGVKILACAEKSAEVMLTTDDDIVKTFRANNSLIKIRVENPVRWLMEVTENER